MTRRNHDPTQDETLDAPAGDRSETVGPRLDAQRDDHLERRREIDAGAELGRLRRTLEELEIENLELLRGGQRSQERVADLEQALELARQSTSAAEASATAAGEVIVAMQESIGWRLTRPLRACAAVARRLLRRRPPTASP